MHFIALVTMNLPSISENKEETQLITNTLTLLEECYRQNPNSLILMKIARFKSLLSSFSRAVDNKLNEIMEPYYQDTENPAYLDFEDYTEIVTDEYTNGRIDCIKLPQGNILRADDYHLANQFCICDGKVFQKVAGPLFHIKRTKKAKKMKALVSYPQRKLYETLAHYAEEVYNYIFDEEHQRYGYYFNPNMKWDWFSIGGRWADLFLVKTSCLEYFQDDRSWTNSYVKIAAPSGYIWVCAARKKDIEWQVMYEWKIQNLTERFQRLEKMYHDGKLDPDMYATITEEGIIAYGRVIYYKDEPLDAFLNRYAASWRHYPVYFHDIVNEEQWISLDNYQETEEMGHWVKQLDSYIDSLSDDTILVGVDYHI